MITAEELMDSLLARIERLAAENSRLRLLEGDHSLRTKKIVLPDMPAPFKREVPF